MNRKKVLPAAILVLGLAILLFAGIRAYRFWYDRKAPNFKGGVEFYVYPGMEASAVLDTLVASGEVKSEESLRRTFRREGAMDSMKPGHYRLDATCSSTYAARMLRKGWQSPVNLVLSGAIRSPKVLARKIGAKMLVDSAEVASFIYSNDSLRRYGVDTTLLFTLVIPDTYEILWTASVREIMDRLRAESDAFWTEERLAAARAQGLTRAQAVTLASIVDGETNYVPEQPTVAGVYLNRLHRGMKLQADPTIAYCFGYTLSRILKSHLQVDSPYNTYMYAGLPPGPISCPPKSCIEAVLHPAAHSYIFFCADPSFNGSHRFATTYSEHLDNARAFQRALTERQRQRRMQGNS